MMVVVATGECALRVRDVAEVFVGDVERRIVEGRIHFMCLGRGGSICLQWALEGGGRRCAGFGIAVRCQGEVKVN